jgi:hypothetical protein
MRKSGIVLSLAGLIGGIFFWATDPRYGWLRSAESTAIIDAANEAQIGTFVGVAGCAVVLVIGLWLMMRRTA